MRQRQSAFTIVEVLVVIAIIGVLVGMLLSAIQLVRSKADCVACQSNLHQVGVGIHVFHDTYQFLPPNGQLGQSGMPSSSAPPDKQTGSWAYSLLPFVEQPQLFQQPDATVAVAEYHCPARRPAQAEQGNAAPPGSPPNYVPRARSDFAANSMVMGVTGVLHLQAVADGTQHTLLVGEKMLARCYKNGPPPGSFDWDHAFLLGGLSNNMMRWANLIVRDGAEHPTATFTWNDDAPWGAVHVGAANFLFVDGSVRPLLYTTATPVIDALRTPSAGELVPGDL